MPCLKAFLTFLIFLLQKCYTGWKCPVEEFFRIMQVFYILTLQKFSKLFEKSHFSLAEPFFIKFKNFIVKRLAWMALFWFHFSKFVL